MRKLTETEKAYIAGIIDGEGCVRLAKRKNSCMACVIVTNSKDALLCYLKETTGAGCIYKYDRTFGTNWNCIHRWQIVAKQARELLKQILPYLIIKREVAELVLSMPLQRGSNRHLPLQAQLFNRVAVLNRRGRLPVVE